mgnify:CR=1 FL=1
MSITENREKYIRRILRWHPEYSGTKFETMSDNQLYAVYKELERKRDTLESQIYALLEAQALVGVIQFAEVHTASSNRLQTIIDNYSFYRPSHPGFKMPEEMDDVEILSPDELYQILGDDPSAFAPQSLLNKGYIIEPGTSLNHQEYEKKKRLEEEIKKEIILILSQTHQLTGFDNSKENLKRLRNSSLEQLKYLYEEYQEHLNSLPSVNAIKMKLENKKEM